MQQEYMNLILRNKDLIFDYFKDVFIFINI